MKKQLIYFFFSILLPLLLLTGCGQNTYVTGLYAPTTSSETPYPRTVENYHASGAPVSYTYTKVPQRVVITHPSATELFLELGLENHILSTVPPYSAPLPRLAEKYKQLSIMKAQYAPSQEELLAMSPDMIIGWSHHFTDNQLGSVSSWHQRRIPTFIMQSTLFFVEPTLESAVYACISDIGKIFAITEKTNAYIRQMKSRVSQVQASLKDIPKKKSLIVLQNHGNGQFSLYGRSSLISHLISLAGGQNLCELPVSFVGAEKILLYDPDYVIYIPYTTNSSYDYSQEEAIQQLQSLRGLQNIPSVKEGRIIPLPFTSVNDGGLRAVDTIETIAHQLYPNAF